jgi:hypothetical protein
MLSNETRYWRMSVFREKGYRGKSFGYQTVLHWIKAGSLSPEDAKTQTARHAKIAAIRRTGFIVRGRCDIVRERSRPVVFRVWETRGEPVRRNFNWDRGGKERG